jgi:hypothetical protein
MSALGQKGDVALSLLGRPNYWIELASLRTPVAIGRGDLRCDLSDESVAHAATGPGAAITSSFDCLVIGAF